ncbi:MAG: C69 family dipeptidase [Candidatus Helarchaeota archaeon]
MKFGNFLKLKGCDTLIALRDATKDGTVIFGKNSDRPYDEAQNLVHVPCKKYSKGQLLKCTYISIPQAEQTYEILICQPYWIWGAEMGVNEFGVCIGNEAVWTIERYLDKGLLGMDLLRLGLERGKTAKESMNIIINLLEQYGQGGACSVDGGMNYHNSFLIVDSKEAWVLETAGKWWVAEHIENGVRAISNSLSIRGKGDLRRDGIIDYAISRNLIKDDDEFDFAKIFSEGYIPDEPSPYSRDGRAIQLLNENFGNITEKKMMQFLRDHEAGICMHGSFVSTASQVSKIYNDRFSVNWFTNASSPCQNFYKPYTLPYNGTYTIESGPYSRIDINWNWTKFEKFRSKLIRNSKDKKEKYYLEINKIEDEIIKEINDLYIECSNDKEKLIKLINEKTNQTWELMEKIYTNYSG